MQQNYYQILGITQEATARELRRAYRQMAVKYHPDSSEIPDAHKYFVIVNEAYQTLNDPAKRKKYDLKLDYHKRTSFTHDANVAQPYYKNTYRPPTTTKPIQQEHEFEKYIFYVRISSIFACFLVLLLIFDYALISPTSTRRAQKILLAEGPGGEISTRIIGSLPDKSIERVLVDLEKIERIDVGENYQLLISPIFNITVYLDIVSSQTQESENYVLEERIVPHYGIFNVFSFFLVLLFGSGICSLFLSKDHAGYLFNFGLLNILLIVITIVITYNS